MFPATTGLPETHSHTQTILSFPHGRYYSLRAAGRRAKLEIGLYGDPGNCAALYATKSSGVDDVTIGLDPNFPGLKAPRANL